MEWYGGLVKNEKRRKENISPDDIVAIIASTNNIGDDYSAEVSDHGTAEQRKRWFWHGYNDENFSRQRIYDLIDD